MRGPAGKQPMMNVAERKQASAPAEAQHWLASFEAALQAKDARRAAELFHPDGLWRDVLAFTWTIQTMSGRAAIAATLGETLARTAPRNFHIPAKRTPPRWVTRAGTEAIEALFEFETAFGRGAGVVRLSPDSQSRLRAWTIVTTLEELKGHEEAFRVRPEPDSTRDFGADNWSDRLAKARAYADHDPTVIVVGGGQAGLSIAARLHQLGVDTLIVDRHERIGDNWRTRYHSLTLHNEVHVNHLPYLPFPPTFPVYIPKDKLANWFEILRRRHGAEFLDGDGACRRKLQRKAQGMARHAAAFGWHRARDAAASSDFRNRRQQHSVHARPARARRLRRHQGAFRRLQGRGDSGKAARRSCSAAAPAATTSRRNCTRTAPTSPSFSAARPMS